MVHVFDFIIKALHLFKGSKGLNKPKLNFNTEFGHYVQLLNIVVHFIFNWYCTGAVQDSFTGVKKKKERWSHQQIHIDFALYNPFQLDPLGR